MSPESPDETLARLAGNRAKLVQAGEAFDLLMERYRKRILGFIGPRAPAGVSADDLAQDVWLRVWRALPTWQTGPFRGWLFQIARNLLKDASKPTARRRLTLAGGELFDVPFQGSSPLEELLGSEFAERLRLCLEQLRDERRQVIEGFYQGETHEEMAARFTCPVGTVKSRLQRARTDLAQCLQLNNP